MGFIYEQGKREQAMTPDKTDYDLVAAAIAYLEQHYQQQPQLDELADHLHLSPFHLQRLFSRWAGVSPKRFVQYLTANHAKALLANEHSVLDATYATGLSSPGRLHDLLVVTEAVTPGEFKSGGAGLTIAYGRHSSPFGEALVGVTERGICALAFVDAATGGWAAAVAELQARWPAAHLVEDCAQSALYAEVAFRPRVDAVQSPLRLLLKGTNFQLKVWEALLRIPAGVTCSYEEVAAAIGRPGAARAVGSAVGSNPIGYLIPCHRVIRKSGIVDGYHWGTTRKKALLAYEAAHRDQPVQVA
jgi:AraC family transcriptional regulator of adaptative response/methylated-DNA-[protein]-cysteine methyltransferase